MDNQKMQADFGTKRRKVAITISETSDGIELEVHVMVKPIWLSSTKISDAQFEENRILLLIANKMLDAVAYKVTELKNE